MIVAGSKSFGGWRSTRLIGLMIKKHSEKSAFIIKLCRYLLAISRNIISFSLIINSLHLKR